jgi:hypothetical protein
MRKEERAMVHITIARNCWIDPETGEFVPGWFEAFLRRLHRDYPDAEVEILDYGRCITVRCGDADQEAAIERDLQLLSIEAMFEWAGAR